MPYVSWTSNTLYQPVWVAKVAEAALFSWPPNSRCPRLSVCAATNGLPNRALINIYGATKQQTERGESMNKTNDALWLAFEALAKKYPDDDGVRMTADLTRWLLEQRQRLQLPVPPIIQTVAHTLMQDLNTAATV
jgi:hypothetical protein